MAKDKEVIKMKPNYNMNPSTISRGAGKDLIRKGKGIRIIINPEIFENQDKDR